ncbi:MAG: riboflavin biosynthesis protein RibF [Synergistaceae bacterium]|nr:riboflavin biosynthesis protein RibF [Synergistaceae bacterium]
MLITIGSFDGFHKGHEKLFEVCRQNSQNNDWGIVTFSPHPSEYMGKLNHSMFTLNERGFLSEIFDVPKFLVFKFDEAFKNLSAEEFINILVKNFQVDGIVAGSDFHFGRERLGNADSLEKICGGRIKIFKLELFDKKIYSSTQAREKISSGEVEDVQKILGYPFFMISNVVHGNARGRTMNFPTANINLKNRIVPADGVYSTAVLINHEWHCGALSIGNNPTFGDVHETRAEVFITDFHGDIYGSELLILFLKRVRGIQTFETREALMTQINHDIETCEEIFKLKTLEAKKFLDRAQEIYYTKKKFAPEIINIKSCL